MTLNDAIGKDIFIIDNDSYNDADLNKLTAEELEVLKLKIANNIIRLSTAIKNKQIDYAMGGEGCTKEWYTARKHILSVNQRILPYIKMLINKRRKKERTLSDYFMAQARTELVPGHFSRILNNAKREMQIMREGMG